MVNWQITAKTIYCDAVDDEVTLMVYKDASCHCTGFRKYNEPNAVTQKMISEKTRHLKRSIKCEGEQCYRLTQYKDKIMAEESH